MEDLWSARKRKRLYDYFKAAHAKDFLDKESEYLALAQLIITQSESILGSSGSCFWTKKITTYTETVIDKNTGEEDKD